MYGQSDLDFAYADELASDATYNGTTAVRVYFDRPYGEAIGMAGTVPTARARASEFPSNACVGNTLVIDGTTFTIKNWEPIDDGAEVLLMLEL